MTWQRVRIDIPDDFGPQDRQRLSDEVVAFIINRSLDGKDKMNRKFPRYSKSYEKRKGQSNVDLYLSGEMLNDLKTISHRKGSLLIGYENGTKSNSKAEGNILGTYGGAPTGKQRDFLGITQKDLDALIRKVSG